MAPERVVVRDYSFVVLDTGRVTVTAGALDLPDWRDYIIATISDGGLQIDCDAFSVFLEGFPVQHLADCHSLSFISCDSRGAVLMGWDCIIS